MGARCEKCGCFINIKVLFLKMSCPENKWGKQ
jgi:hypothetical protein